MRSNKVASYEMFADDNQLLGIFPCGNLVQGKSAVAKVEVCIQSIGRWLLKNNLTMCLNGPKAEFMAISSGKKESSVSHIEVDEELIPSADAVRDLGACNSREQGLSECLRQPAQHRPYP
jgi:hypothetical protein